MTRKKGSRFRTGLRNRRSNGGGGGGGLLGSMDLSARRDLIVAGGYVNNAGSQVGWQSWNNSAVTLAKNTQMSAQAIVLPQAVTAINAPPSIGECRVLDIEGSIFLCNNTASGQYIIGMGIYISKYDTRTSTWGIRLPSGAGSDAARDDWLALRVLMVTLPLPANVTDPMVLEIKLGLPHPILLGGGEALHVVVDNNTGSAGSIDTQHFWRTRIADVT